MQNTTLILALCLMSVAAFYAGRGRSVALVGGPANSTQLHSLPGYYGYFTAIWCLLPALGVLSLWIVAEPRVIVALVVNGLPESTRSLSAGELNLLVNNIQNLAAGDAVSGEVSDMLREAAQRFQDYSASSRRLLAILTVGLGGLGGAIAWRRIRPDLRARNRVEQVVLSLI